MNLPTQTITFLFTDIEGSTRLWERNPQAMRTALARHDTLLQHAVQSNNGKVFKTVGDGFCAAFATPVDAVAAARDAQRALFSEPWPDAIALRVRMALHTGEAEQRDADYFGPPLNRVARLLAIGHGGQILLSQAVCELLPAESTLLDRGSHRLKDLQQPEHVFQLQLPGLPADFPPLRSLHNTNLPIQATSFIGRQQEMREVNALLATTRLLTLTGAGGVGKTRLALQVAAEEVEAFPDGVWLVELAALAEPALVAQTVAAALGLRDEPGRAATDSVTAYLQSRTLLLLLDNCEHLLDACAALTDALLRSCPQVQILATSREPLHVAGERIWHVPSLVAPKPEALVGEEKEVTGRLMDYDAPRLFVERALVQRQDFALTRRNVPLVAHLCRRLDGIPLAIELAAARVRSLSVEEINNRLDQRLRLLTGGSRTALPRQQTLRALMDWSYELLNEAEKTLLCRLSVFAGGWTLQAAEQVCAGEGNGAPIEAWEVLDLLTSLVDKSLVVAEPQEALARYRLLETVRQYATDRLAASGESARMRERHQDFYRAWSEETAPQLWGPEQPVWLHRWEQEHDNLRAALEGGNPETALRIAGVVWRFWYYRGYFREGCERLALMLADARVIERPTARAKALGGAAVLAYAQSDYDAAQPLFEESLRLYRELQDKEGIAFSLGNLGIIASKQGDYPTARALYEESLALKRELGNKLGIAATLVNLGIVAYEQGDYPTARLLYEESLALEREAEHKWGIAGLLDNLGNVALKQGNHATAQAFYEESLTLYRELDSKQGIGTALTGLGDVACDQGDYAAAQALYLESLASQRELGTKLNLVELLEEFAALAAAQQQAERAVRLWGATEALREEISSPLAPSDRSRQGRRVEQVRAQMGENSFAEAWAAGRAMSLEQTIAYVQE